jgi:hypothetical protein
VTLDLLARLGIEIAPRAPDQAKDPAEGHDVSP